MEEIFVDNKTEKEEIERKGNSISSISDATFEGIIQEINGVLNSDKTDFGKVFAISRLTRPEIIYNIEIPDFTLVPTQINGVEV